MALFHTKLLFNKNNICTENNSLQLNINSPLMFLFLSSRVNTFRIFRRYLHQGRSFLLGIETSCDDTCAALVDSAGNVFSSIRKSQHEINKRNRGIIPAVASKFHKDHLPEVVEEAMRGYSVSSLDGIALTIGPGLAPCLGEGLTYAIHLATEWSKPIILVNHMEAHAMVPTMQNVVFYPAIGFMVSGGNTEMVYCPDHCHPFLKLGDTLDDACGECMDKVFRSMCELVPNLSTLPKHGGAQISEWARQYTETEEFKSKANRILFPLPLSKQHCTDFSFSGLKTYSVRYLCNLGKSGTFDLPQVLRFSYYFEGAIIRHLIHQLENTLDQFPEVNSLVSTHLFL